jgi:hypothetical protein
MVIANLWPELGIWEMAAVSVPDEKARSQIARLPLKVPLEDNTSRPKTL